MMTTKVDKSDDELELERLVFGDSDGIKQRIGGDRTQVIQTQPTELEHLEDDQVTTPIDTRLTVVIHYRYGRECDWRNGGDS